MTRRTILKATGFSLAQGLFIRAGFTDASPATQPAKEAAMSPMVSVKVINDKGELVGPVTIPKVIKTDEQWKKQLTADQYVIARAKGTERPFCGNLLDNHLEGIYSCICCGLPL